MCKQDFYDNGYALVILHLIFKFVYITKDLILLRKVTIYKSIYYHQTLYFIL